MRWHHILICLGPVHIGTGEIRAATGGSVPGMGFPRSLKYTGGRLFSGGGGTGGFATKRIWAKDEYKRVPLKREHMGVERRAVQRTGSPLQSPWVTLPPKVTVDEVRKIE
ncbi:hypothetical protein DFH09DRAFT_1099142 [Mycena vulgaris]|nr:hypothetical protein DFH09DRAFT_1099142 [Mycena vulgaris]